MEVVEAPHVGVEQRPTRTPGPSGRSYHRVLADQSEGGAGDRLGDTEPGPEALDEGRLPRAQVTGQQQDVAGDTEHGQLGGQGPGLIGCRRAQDQGRRLRHELHPRSCLARTRSARISATTAPPDRRAAAGWYVGTRCHPSIG